MAADRKKPGLSAAWGWIQKSFGNLSMPQKLSFVAFTSLIFGVVFTVIFFTTREAFLVFQPDDNFRQAVNDGILVVFIALIVTVLIMLFLALSIARTETKKYNAGNALETARSQERTIDTLIRIEEKKSGVTINSETPLLGTISPKTDHQEEN